MLASFTFITDFITVFVNKLNLSHGIRIYTFALCLIALKKILSPRNYLSSKCPSLVLLHMVMDGHYTRVGTLIVATIYLQLIQNRYMFRSLTVLQCSHQHCVQPVTSDVEVVG